jgi:hypothetical protein
MSCAVRMKAWNLNAIRNENGSVLYFIFCVAVKFYLFLKDISLRLSVKESGFVGHIFR